MKNRRGTFIAMVLAVFVMSLTLSAKNNRTDRMYNPATVETITGTVTELTTVNRMGLHIRVKTDKGITGVHLGPQWYIEEKIKLTEGGNVTVTGSRVNFDGEEVIIAKTLTAKGITVELRDNNGVPLWAGKGNKRKK